MPTSAKPSSLRARANPRPDSFACRAWRCLGLATALSVGVATLGWSQTQKAPAPNEAPFLAENDRAMSKMMTDMAMKPTGDVDHDFVEMMVPHHQGAIDMAQALLRYGHNEPLRRLAQEIIVTQQQEIAAMRFALGEPLPPSGPAPDQLPDRPAKALRPNSMPLMDMQKEP